MVDDEDEDEGHPEEGDRREDGGGAPVDAAARPCTPHRRRHPVPLRRPDPHPRGVADALQVGRPEGQEGLEADGEEAGVLIEVPAGTHSVGSAHTPRATRSFKHPNKTKIKLIIFSIKFKLFFNQNFVFNQIFFFNQIFGNLIFIFNLHFF